MDEDLFESPKSLVAEAAPSIRELDAIIQMYLRGAIQQFDRINPETGLREVGFRFTEGVPRRARVLASRILKDLRDALDQATFAAARGLGDGKGTATYFPFCQNPDDFKILFAPKKGRCRDVPAEIRPYLLALEPYESGEGYSGGNNLLRGLGYVSGPNKHQITLHLTPEATGAHVHELNYHGGAGRLFYPWDPHKLEVIILSVAPDAKFTCSITPAFHCSFKGARALTGQPVTTVLGELTRMVEGIVSGVEAETARLLRERAG